MCWYKYYEWPESYARFIQYIFSRYQANNTVLSPIHLDIIDETVSPDDYTAAIRFMEKKYGLPPFGTLLSANANPSTLENWGEDSWVTLHQIGNMREHNNYWYLTEIFNLKRPKPALNGEPYYAGYRDARGPGSANYTRGARLNSVYRAQWFNPRDGTWMYAGNGKLVSYKTGIIRLPDFPGDTDWGLQLIYESTVIAKVVKPLKD